MGILSTLNPRTLAKGISYGNPTFNHGKRYRQLILQGVEFNDVYTFNDTKTTDFGPAYANVRTSSAISLQWTPPNGRKFSYALWYDSGSDTPTGNSDQSLSLSACFPLMGHWPFVSFVRNVYPLDLSENALPRRFHAISNMGIFQDMIETCGDQGTECHNTGKITPVCETIHINLLVPGADMIPVVLAVFAHGDENPGGDTPTDCTKKKYQQLYAGGLTAPGYRTKKGEAGRNLMECRYPHYDGPSKIAKGASKANDPHPSTTVSNSKKRHTRDKDGWWATYTSAGGHMVISNAECIPDPTG